MELQKIFKGNYVEQLRREVKNGTLVTYYESDTFLYDEQKVWKSSEIIEPTKCNLMLPDEKGLYDFENAIILFEAYKTLTPLQASDIRFWTYLAHVDHYKYMCIRWPSVKKQKKDIDASKYIQDHWYISSPIQTNFLRHGIASLWWTAYLTYDETRKDPYELTKILYTQLDFATRTLGTYAFARHKEAVFGVLEYIQQNPKLFDDRFQNKSRYITKYLNQVGGTRPISYFKRDFFKATIDSVRDKIALVA
jgi:hypothetical protein